ncbi:universal stress protein [Kutzneria sp. 744]|uniref:universal stress protein n=1 Tax=Kutzneria sp. (strain 744) TaxID=345341 RepID=UPI0003EEC5B9|nr:universal stress protein [Kutzneria sp. 744]EWM10968.1 universal stress protein [Kutzneria sp. 744]
MTSSFGGPVLVGFDGSDGARGAALWAAREAVVRDRPVRLVQAVESQWSPAMTPGALPGYPPEPDLDQIRQALSELLESEAERLRRDQPALAVTVALVDGFASDALANEAENVDANLVVVGGSGHGALARTLLGSTASEIVHATSRPVVVVRSEAAHAPGSSVVIGVGGLGTGDHAARFALDFAARHKLPVRAVHGRSASPFALLVERLTTEQRNAAAAEQDVADAAVVAEVEAWREAHPDLDIQREEIDSQPVEALLARAADAALLVVGSRHRGGLQRVILGSIGHAVLNQAPCPVAVVREPSDDQG